MSSGETVVVRCTGVAARAVEVEVPAGIWPTVEEYLSGFVGIGPASVADPTWRLALDLSADGGATNGLVADGGATNGLVADGGATDGGAASTAASKAASTAKHYGDYDDTLVWRDIDGAGRIVRLSAAAESAYAPVHVVRIVRTLLRLDAAQHDPSALFLHAGMVSWQGHGLALVGNKRSGKTSTVIAATAAGAEFVSNDDLSLHRDSDGLVGVGWPRSVSIRLDTLEPLGLTLPTRSAHPANTHRDDAKLLMPFEIGHMLDSRVTPRAPLRAVLFPSFGSDGTTTLRRLDQDDAAGLLIANFLTPPVKDDDLVAWFELPSKEELVARAYQVAAAVPAFDLSMSLTQLGCGTEVIRILDEAVAI